MFEETLQSEDCTWFEDEDGDDHDDFDDEDVDERDDDEDQEGEDRRPKSIRFRCSPICRFSPAVRMLAERHIEQINELLNLSRGVLADSESVRAPYPPYRFASRLERIYYGCYLTGLGELKAVEDEVRTEWDRLHDDLLSVTRDSPRADFQRIEHHLRDCRILVALAGCHARYVFDWWNTTLIDIKRSEVLHRFYTARDGMRSRDPQERKAARARDAKRRKTRRRKEYLAEYEARPDVRARRAAQKRAARAAARARRSQPEQREMLPLSATAPVDLSHEAIGGAPAEIVPAEASGGDVEDRPRVIIAQGSASTPSPAADRARAA